MNIVTGKTAGFCMGVRSAVEGATKEVENEAVTYCLGDLVHNPQVIEKLSKKGLKIINSLSEIPNPKGKKVIFRAHGVMKSTYEEAKKLGLTILDFTCPKVIAIHKMVERYANEGFYIFFIGEKNHAEVRGTASFCGNNYTVIETEEDLNLAINEAKKQNINKILVMAQTTFNLEKFNMFAEKIEKELSPNSQIDIKSTICDATRLRQEETEKLAGSVDYMIIIGGRKSSNTNKLYDISCKNCKNVVMLEKADELEDVIEKIKNCNTVGIMAGASTPQESILEVQNLLENKAIYV